MRLRVLLILCVCLMLLGRSDPLTKKIPNPPAAHAGKKFAIHQSVLAFLLLSSIHIQVKSQRRQVLFDSHSHPRSQLLFPVLFSNPQIIQPIPRSRVCLTASLSSNEPAIAHRPIFPGESSPFILSRLRAPRVAWSSRSLSIPSCPEHDVLVPHSHRNFQLAHLQFHFC